METIALILIILCIFCYFYTGFEIFRIYNKSDHFKIQRISFSLVLYFILGLLGASCYSVDLIPATIFVLTSAMGFLLISGFIYRWGMVKLINKFLNKNS
jgi:hypothetical protein